LLVFACFSVRFYVFDVCLLLMKASEDAPEAKTPVERALSALSALVDAYVKEDHLTEQAAQELGLNTNQALDVAAQLAIDVAALPLNLSDEGFTDAGEYLRMRGHNESQVRSLQVTFGQMLKKHYQQVHGVAPPGHFHAEFGGVVKAPYSYNRQADREFLNGTYQMLTLTDTYRKQVPNALLALNSVA
jgi:antitoxin component of RelBE/YafQ-DinJ toxin-antitoxin module